MNDPRSMFDSMDLALIDGFVKERRQEDLNLDFICIGKPDQFSADDRRNLAKALSGFANSDGGIIIWGISAKPGPDGVDAACSKHPVPDLKRARSQLESFTGQAVNPIVEGVQHKGIADKGQSGYLVTCVPASDSGPHMAKMREDRYYKRSGDSFYRMEHFDIEDMFGRRRRPKLSLFTEAVYAGKVTGPGSTQCQVDVWIGIQNSGRGIARFPYLALWFEGGQLPADWGHTRHRRVLLPSRDQNDRPRYVYEFPPVVDCVVHVDSVLSVTCTGVSFPESEMKAAELRIGYRISAADLHPIEDVEVVPGDVLVAAWRAGPDDRKASR